MKILPIIVIYNDLLKDCQIYKSFLQYYPGVAFLYDNSKQPINGIYESESVIYVHDKSNGGVSKAYNSGAKWAKEHGFDYVLLLDEDTTFPRDYMEILSKAINANKNCSVFAPQITYGDEERIFSPSKFGRCGKVTGVRLPYGIHSLHDYLPVNSGCGISVKAFYKAGGYNDNIKLDFADFDFFIRLRSIAPTFCLVEGNVHQSFSNEVSDADKLFRRFKMYIDGAVNFGQKSLIGMQVLRHTLALTARTKSLRFIKYYLSNYLKTK